MVDLVEVKAIVSDAQALQKAGKYADAAADLAKAAAMLEADPRHCRGTLIIRVKGLQHACEITAKGAPV